MQIKFWNDCLFPAFSFPIFFYVHCLSVRRSSTKKSDFFTKRYSQPQLNTGHEFSYPVNQPNQPLHIENIAPNPLDVKCGLDSALPSTSTGNKRKPYLNRRSQIYRFSCDNCTDDYHSNSGDTVAFGDKFTVAAENCARNKMQSDSVSSSSSSAQNRCLTEHDGNEQAVAPTTNPIDLTTDNLPAVDTPDACDKAALR